MSAPINKRLLFGSISLGLAAALLVANGLTHWVSAHQPKYTAAPKSIVTKGIPKVIDDTAQRACESQYSDDVITHSDVRDNGGGRYTVHCRWEARKNLGNGSYMVDNSHTLDEDIDFFVKSS